MDLATTLKRLEKLEQEMAELYSWFAQVFVADQEAAGFFASMAEQEVAHAGLVRFERRLVCSDHSSYRGLDIDPGGLDQLESWIQKFRGQNEQPSLGQALVLAMRVESHAAEHLHRTVFAEFNSELHELVGNLSRSDWKHFEALRRFADARSDSLDNI